jgi:hypothetical protein
MRTKLIATCVCAVFLSLQAAGQAEAANWTNLTVTDIMFGNVTNKVLTPGNAVTSNTVSYSKTGAGGNWKVTMRSTQAFFTGGGGTKPIGDLGWKTTLSTYTAVTMTDTIIRTGTVAGGGQSGNFPVDWQILLSFSDRNYDTPANYTATLTFTISDN